MTQCCQKMQNFNTVTGVSLLTTYCLAALEKRGKTLDTYDKYRMNKLYMDYLSLQHEQNSNKTQKKYEQLCAEIDKVALIIMEYIKILDIFSQKSDSNECQVVTMAHIQQVVTRTHFLEALLNCTV